MGTRFKVNILYFVERRRSTPAPKEEEKVNEEQWSLREVVFVEDVKNVPVGKVGASAIWPLILVSYYYILFLLIILSWFSLGS